MRKVFIVGGGYGYAKMFLSNCWEIADNADEADLIQFTGGEDVTPYIYWEQKHPYTFNNEERDEEEGAVYENAIMNNIPMAGICRGGQFLNVMNGGKMFQHVTNHTRDHFATYCVDGREILVTSTHHQMMRPAPHGQVFLVAQQEGTKEWFPKGAEKPFKAPVGAFLDTEGVYYPDTNSLCFQPHPEFYKEGPLVDLYFEVINKFIFKE